MRKQGGIFQKWFSSFTTAVFTQSLHAVMLVFSLKVLSAFIGESNRALSTGPADPKKDKTIIISVLAFMCLTAITRFERVIKDLFGIGSSQHLGDTKQNLHKTVAGARSTLSMAKKISAPAMKAHAANKEMRQLKSQIDDKVKSGELQQEYKRKRNGDYKRDMFGRRKTNGGYIAPAFASESGASSVAPQNSVAEVAQLSGRGFAEEMIKREQKASTAAWDKYDLVKRGAITSDRSLADLKRDAEAHDKNIERIRTKLAPSTATTTGSSARQSSIGAQQAVNEATQAAKDGNQPTVYYQDGENNYITAEQKKAKEAQALIDRYNAARKARNIAVKDSFMNAGATIAGVGFAAGAWDEFGEIATAGNAISQPFVTASTKLLERHENKKIQHVQYQVAADTGGEEAKMKVKISPQFVNSGNAYDSVKDFVNSVVDENRIRKGQKNVVKVKNETQYQVENHSTVTTTQTGQQLKPENIRVNQNVDLGTRTVKGTINTNYDITNNVTTNVNNNVDTSAIQKQISDVGNQVVKEFDGMKTNSTINTQIDVENNIEAKVQDIKKTKNNPLRSIARNVDAKLSANVNPVKIKSSVNINNISDM